jgi:hypothetical protein
MTTFVCTQEDSLKPPAYVSALGWNGNTHLAAQRRSNRAG